MIVILEIARSEPCPGGERSRRFRLVPEHSYFAEISRDFYLAS